MKTKIFTIFFHDFDEDKKIERMEKKVNDFTKKLKNKDPKITWLQSLAATSFAQGDDTGDAPGGTIICNRLTAIIGY